MNIYYDLNYHTIIIIVVVVVVVVIIKNTNIIRTRAPEYVSGMELQKFPLCVPSI